MWYAVSILSRGEPQGLDSQEGIWEESIVLIRAEDEIKAATAAADLAHEPFSYKSRGGGEIRWSFDSVNCVCAIDAEHLMHGVELFSRFLRPVEVASLKRPFSDEEY